MYKRYAKHIKVALKSESNENRFEETLNTQANGKGW